MYSISINSILQILKTMKKLLLILFLSTTIITSANADGADDWQNAGFNTVVLNLLNQCQGCVLRSTNYSGANLAGAIFL